MAVQDNNQSFVEILTGQGVKNALDTKTLNLDLKDGDGNTALHLAVKNKYIDIVKILLRNKADRTLTNDKGETAEEMITSGGMFTSAKTIELKNILKYYPPPPGAAAVAVAAAAAAIT